MRRTALFAVVLLLAVSSFALSQGAPRSRTIIQDFETQTIRVSLSPELDYAAGQGVRLARTRSYDFFGEGNLRSSLDKAPFPFDQVVLSWNIALPEGTGARIELCAVGDGGESTAWYEMARLGKTPLPLEKLKKDDNGGIRDDTLFLRKPWERLQYRVTLYTVLPHRTPTLRLMAVCYSDSKSRVAYEPQPAPKTHQPWMRSLPVPWRSQLWEEKCISGRICGPTSLAMALEYNGCKMPTADIAADAWDDGNTMFGNWPFLAQAAAKHGFKSWVFACQDYEPIKQEIAAGRPVVLSIRFAKGELTNAPFEATGGHLILCVGMTPNGDLICNDPGSRRSIFSHQVYRKEEMAKAWLNQGGYAICVIPRSRQ